MQKVTEIAIFGGTFDPIHRGHIEPAKQIANWLDIAKITLLPAHIPPHKNAPKVSNEHRLGMLKLAVANESCFTIDRRELSKNSPSYTVETLKEYKQENPNTRLYFLIGLDSLLSFTRWHQWQAILTLCHLVVSHRPGASIENTDSTNKQAMTNLLAKHKATLAEARQVNCGKIIFAPQVDIDVSSTELRAQLAKRNCNESFNQATPLIKQNLLPEVHSYICQHKLYLSTNQ